MTLPAHLCTVTKNHLIPPVPSALLSFEYIDPTATPSLTTAVLNRLFETDKIDAGIKEVIRAHFAGYYNETDAREIISGVLLNSSIIDDVVEGSQVELRMVDEIKEGVFDNVSKKLLLLESPTFDLSIQLNSSACGWLRKHSHNQVIQQIRDVRRAIRRNGNPVEPHKLTNLGVAVYDDHDSALDGVDHKMSAVQQFEIERHGLRGKPRTRLTVEQASSMFNVPLAVRPTYYRDRDEMTRLLAADRNLAYRSLETFAAIVYGTNDEPEIVNRDIDERFLSLWDDYSEANAEHLLSQSPLFAHAFACYAAETLIRPPKKSINRMRTVAGKMVPGDSKWRRLAWALVESWVDTECDPISEFSVATAEQQANSRKGYTVSRSRWNQFVVDAAMYPNAPLGDSVEKIQASLLNMAIEYLPTRDFERIKRLREDETATPALVGS